MAERPRSRLAASSPVCQVCPITTNSSAVRRPPRAAEQSCSVRLMYLQQTVGRKLSSAAPPKIVSRSVSDQTVQFAAANASSAPESRRIAQLPMIIPKGRSDRAWSKSAAGGALSSSAVFFSAFAAASGAGSAETVGVSAGAGAIGLVSAVLVLRSTAVSGGGVAAPRTKFGALEGAMLGAAPETASTPSVRSVSGEGAIAERSSAFSSSEAFLGCRCFRLLQSAMVSRRGSFCSQSFGNRRRYRRFLKERRFRARIAVLILSAGVFSLGLLFLDVSLSGHRISLRRQEWKES